MNSSQRSWIVRRRCQWAFAAWLASTPAALALDPRLSLNQYLHTAWIQSEGSLIPGINTLAQTDDGYLWLGTRQGLWRFDGLRFARWAPLPGEQLADNTVSALAPSRSGGLWIGNRHGLQILEQGHLTDYTGRFGLTAGFVKTLWEDPAGRLWLGGIQAGAPALSVLNSGSAKIIQNVQVSSLTPDREGSVWVYTQRGLEICMVSAGGYHCRREEDARTNAMAQQWELWKGDRAGVHAMLRDHDGNLWVGTAKGLFCVRHGTVERFTRREGLSGDLIWALIEDREGNIWVGTSNGLDRFREPKVARWSTSDGLAANGITSVCATREGDLWVASSGGLDRLRAAGTRHYGPEAGLGSGQVLSLFEDAGQTIWAGTTHGMARLSGDRFEQVPVASGKPFEQVFAIVQDTAGTIWLADAARGLAMLRHGSIEPRTIPDLPAAGIYQMSPARGGDLWIGYYQGGVSIWNGRQVRHFSARNGLADGPVQAIFEDSAGNMWVGTGDGLSRYGDGKWSTWTASNGIPAGGVLGVIEDRSARLWLLTRAGVAPLPVSPADARDGRMPENLALTVYGPGDAIRMREVAGQMNPRLTLSTDGRLWFGTEDGLAGIDPASIHMNRVPPPVSIEELVVDGKRMRSPDRGLGVHGRSIEVEYTALSLTLPETVRFRYMLEPVSQAWVDAGTTRRMAYANLQPGRYRFHVTACNNDGEWNPSGAVLAFIIEPRFYQTWWFFIACVASSIAMVGLVGYAIHRGRVNRLNTRFQLALQERTRLSRDLHDTLLQGFAGVVYQLEAASRQMGSQPELGRARLSKALEQADQSLCEARQALSSMRLSALEGRTLGEALRIAGEQMTADTPIRFELTVRGAVRELSYELQACLYIIGREAMTNAATHAQPERIAVLLSYGDEAVSLKVHDDGKGFNPGAESKPDHWGLPGMQERARHAGAVLNVESTPGRGTVVEITANRL